MNTEERKKREPMGRQRERNTQCSRRMIEREWLKEWWNAEEYAVSRMLSERARITREKQQAQAGGDRTMFAIVRFRVGVLPHAKVFPSNIVVIVVWIYSSRHFVFDRHKNVHEKKRMRWRVIKERLYRSITAYLSKNSGESFLSRSLCHKTSRFLKMTW